MNRMHYPIHPDAAARAQMLARFARQSEQRGALRGLKEEAAGRKDEGRTMKEEGGER